MGGGGEEPTLSGSESEGEEGGVGGGAREDERRTMVSTGELEDLAPAFVLSTRFFVFLWCCLL